jgi:ribulose-5-phosphate 4-epimerase/fuculose-1-phosphate aldolase
MRSAPRGRHCILWHGVSGGGIRVLFVGLLCHLCEIHVRLPGMGAAGGDTPGSRAGDEKGTGYAGDAAGQRAIGDEGSISFGDRCVSAMAEVGRQTVLHRLVDSHFGNVSVRWNRVLYISQSGSSLDELESCIDPCPLDGSSSAGITASSELTAHRRIYEETGDDVVLHGHPKFCAILSLDCDDMACQIRGRCHTRCETERFIGDIPIVPGEVGTGPFGLCNTVPGAMKEHRGVIVFGHGLFTAARKDFQDALQHMFDVERMCMEAFIARVS